MHEYVCFVFSLQWVLDSMEFHYLNSVSLQVQALVGYEKTIKHLDEHLVDISTKVSTVCSLMLLFIWLKWNIAATICWCITVFTAQGVTKPKEVRKFKGEGMPLHYSTKKGDLYVTFEVIFPTSLTEDQKTKIKAILG